MAVRVTRVAVLLACLPVAGCGTVANLANPRPSEGGRAPFGGVRRDVAWMDRSGAGEPVAGARPESEPHRHNALVFLGAVDLPFSLVGDVVTWPYTAAFTFINQPAPVPPVALAPPPPGPPAPPEVRPQTAPPESLPEPSKRPEPPQPS